MGLAVCVGALADLLENDPEGAEWIESDIKAINECLVKNGVDEHIEPRTLPELESRDQTGGFPYSWTHYLRRIVAHAMAEPGWKATPVAEGEDPTSDEAVIDATINISGHFICHSDSEGYYVPKDFEEVIFGDEKMTGGGIIGSSYRVMEEMQLAAKALGIDLVNGELSDEGAAAINDVDENDPFMIEKIVWLSFYEAARLSIKHNTMIVFQ
ncbi:hypothetical protein KA344_07925 [bacterium]|nr:hypothetical protein [bacterium]